MTLARYSLRPLITGGLLMASVLAGCSDERTKEPQGSACDAGVPQASHVLLAMGSSEEFARSSLRFSLGHSSTEADVDALIEAIAPVVERARNAALSTKANGAR